MTATPSPLSYGGQPCNPKPVQDECGFWMTCDDYHELTEVEKAATREWFKKHKAKADSRGWMFIVSRGKP